MRLTPPHRSTRQRQAVLDELRKTTSHPTAREVHDLVRRRLSKISLGTVYRNLELLTRMGTIRKLEYSGHQSRFDANTAPHCHIRCVRCGRVDDFPAPPIDLPDGAADYCLGYRVLECEVQYTGLCARCGTVTDNSDKES